MNIFEESVQNPSTSKTVRHNRYLKKGLSRFRPWSYYINSHINQKIFFLLNFPCWHRFRKEKEENSIHFFFFLFKWRIHSQLHRRSIEVCNAFWLIIGFHQNERRKPCIIYPTLFTIIFFLLLFLFWLLLLPLNNLWASAGLFFFLDNLLVCGPIHETCWGTGKKSY